MNMFSPTASTPLRRLEGCLTPRVAHGTPRTNLKCTHSKANSSAFPGRGLQPGEELILMVAYLFQTWSMTSSSPALPWMAFGPQGKGDRMKRRVSGPRAGCARLLQPCSDTHTLQPGNLNIHPQDESTGAPSHILQQHLCSRPHLAKVSPPPWYPSHSASSHPVRATGADSCTIPLIPRQHTTTQPVLPEGRAVRVAFESIEAGR